MYRVCIALVDATRARLFTFERRAETDGRDELVERTDLANPQRWWANAVELDDKFARTVVAALRELIDERPTQRAIVCAAPRVLGRLRAAAPGLLPGDIALDELPRDLVRLSPTAVQAELASRGLPPDAPRGQPL
jgi:protein required for attachment to host cells